MLGPDAVGAGLIKGTRAPRVRSSATTCADISFIGRHLGSAGQDPHERAPNATPSQTSARMRAPAAGRSGAAGSRDRTGPSAIHR